jgi:hypothetical protein
MLQELRFSQKKGRTDRMCDRGQLVVCVDDSWEEVSGHDLPPPLKDAIYTVCGMFVSKV